MKNIAMIVAILLLSAGTASAGFFDNDNNDCPGNSCHGGSSNVDTDVDVDQDVDVRNTNINTNYVDADARATQGQEQGQAQGQFQAQGNSQKLTIEDAENPASSAANLYLANCSSGASAQGFGGGGSLGGPDDVCLLLNYAQVAAVFGSPADAAWALGEAKNILQVRTWSLRRFLQAIPIVGRIM